MRLEYLKFCGPALLAVALAGAGCGTYVADRLAQAPNSYPEWIAPHARVMLDFGGGFLTNFPAKYAKVGPPEAELRYRIVDPADYNLQVSVTNWMEEGQRQYTFSFQATVPGATNRWTAAPRGTVVLLHGYGVAQFAMAPWALRLAQDGWRCVLVDLRGHGKSTGDRIFYGTREGTDLSQLLDHLDLDHQVISPVVAVGESYGAALALRWEGEDKRVRSVVAIAPYAELSNAIVNISTDYAGWLPKFLVRSGIRKLPVVLGVAPTDLDTTSFLAQRPVPALFIASSGDKVTSVADIKKLEALASPGSQLVLVPDVSHEALTYLFDNLAPPTISWLDRQSPASP
jgi:pimeloyl-ACP methyl ester carboxylesterase